MFNLFVIGSVQQPTRKKVDHLLPAIDRFAVNSNLIQRLSNAQAGGADDAAMRKIVLGHTAKPGAARDSICRTEDELVANFPELWGMLNAFREGDLADFNSAFEATVAKGRKFICDAAPSLFATMTSGYVLDERHAVVENAADLIKIAAAALDLLDDSDRTGEPRDAEERMRFVRDYMDRAIPRTSVAPPAVPDTNMPLAPAPVEAEEAVITPVDFSAKHAELAELKEAIDAIEGLVEARVIDGRYAPPAMADFARFHRASEPARDAANAAESKGASRQRADAPAPTADQAIKADYDRAMATYSSRLLRTRDIESLPPASRKMLAPLAGAKGEIHADQALARLRLKSQSVSTELLRMPVEADRHVRQIVRCGYLIEIDRNVFEEITCAPMPRRCHCAMLQEMDARHAGRPQLYVLGTGTAYRIDTSFSRYIRGELVHTEPVVAGSKRTTTFRLLNRTEEIVETFTSTEEEQEQEAVSDERFRMEKEVEAETRSEVSLNMGSSVTASYGPVSLAANFGMASSTATQSKERHALEIAQQKMSRALSRIRKKTETRKTSKRLQEDERTSGFTLDNERNPSFTAFFHAIDAEYSNQLVNVGTRIVIRVCMQEFMAPLLHCLMSESDDQKVLKQPIAPDKVPNPLLGNKLLTKFTDIDTVNYVAWLAAFGITDAPAPPDNITVSAHAKGTQGAAWEPGSGSITVPGDYIAYYGVATATMSGGSYLELFVGNTYMFGSGSANLNLTGSVPWAYRGNAGDSFALTIVIHCRPTAAKIVEWQMEIYDAIWAKYRRELSAYENSLQMAKVEAGIELAGRNPRQNEKFVREELMKMVLGATFPQFYYRGLNSMKFGYKCVGASSDGKALTEGPPIPEPDFLDAKAEAPWVTFMSKLFEFENMTFDLKPYFFGNRAKWCSLRKLVDPDPRMQAALNAGHVTIDVPVSLGMEQAFMHYMATGQIWNGQGMPLIGDPLYQALAIEIMNGQNPAGVPVGKPWKTVLPTSLVMVSDNAPPDL